MNIDEMNEEEVKLNFITPAIERAGWKRDLIRMEYVFTAGKMELSGEHAKRSDKIKKADYVLCHEHNTPLAVVEAKDHRDHSVGSGMQQAIDYATALDLPFAYSSNGEGFLEHDMLTGKERELSMDALPSPEELWERFKAVKQITPEQEPLVSTPYFYGSTRKSPRYYQEVAINRAVTKISQGQKRLLLVMATGTGKTYTAFQIVWRLLQAKKVKKVLFLADRNILVDQTMMQDFKPLHKVTTKIDGSKMDSAYEVYFSLYQQLAGEEGEEPFRKFAPEFFDLIVIDECHRGSADEASLWHRILDYFEGAIHLGMTATPKETNDISNITYFGEPIYVYSLKQGINDGFLAPYKVIRMFLNKDITGFNPEPGQVDVNGQPIEPRTFSGKEFDRTLIIEERNKLVARLISDYLKRNNHRFDKTIVFCVDIDHAERMRQYLVNENSDLVAQDLRYVTRITGDVPNVDALVDRFIDPDSTSPVIVTTSKLLSTGVDCKTCKLIVLDVNIQSRIEFTQILGRGTRINESAGKRYFTVMDFRGATANFFKPDFDGVPEVVLDPRNEEGGDGLPIEEPPSPDPLPPPATGLPEPPKPHRVYRVRGVDVQFLGKEVAFIDKDGNLIKESFTDYTKKNMLGQYATLEDFLAEWNSAKRKKTLFDELEEHGVLLEALREAAGDPYIGDFDLLCHVAYGTQPLTRAQRAGKVRERGYLKKYSEAARKVLDALLDKYQEVGVRDMESMNILKGTPFRELGSPREIMNLFGGKEGYQQAIQDLQHAIYAA